MSFPVFASGDVLNASDMNAVGLWLVKTQVVGAGVSSVTVTDAFPDDYDCFRIIYSDGSQSVNNSINIRFGASTTGYNAGWAGGFYSGSTNSGGHSNAAQGFVGGGDTNISSVCADVFVPNRAKFTTYTFSGVFVDAAIVGSGRHSVATAYTAFSLLTGGGTMSGGTIRVYAYRK
jgi:hypothetical protein